MKKIGRSEITEEIYWVFKCPSCSNMTDMYDDPDYEEYAGCDHCKKTFKIEDDE